MVAHSKSRRFAVTALALASASTLVLTGCAPDGAANGGSGDSGSTDEFSVLTTVESPYLRDEIQRLADGVCSAENEALPFVATTVPNDDLTNRSQLLASQDALPVIFPTASEAVNPDGDFVTSGIAVDYEEYLDGLGLLDNVQPAAIDAIKQAYDGRLATLPFQFNIEGVFYNKQIFEEQGLEIPTTYDEMMDISQQLLDAGIQPFAVAGGAGWPATRWISTYLFRDVGPDAMVAIDEGTAKLTDPEYVASAAALQNMGDLGYFGRGVGEIDYDTANNQFVTGEVAMMYGLTSLLSVFNDPAQNPLGADNIGLFSFPEVTGGAGDITQFPANAGSPLAMSSKLIDDDVDAWMTCLVENYGSSLLENQGSLSGFTLNEPVEDVAPLTQEVQELMDSSTGGLLWFEALFDAESRDAAKFGIAQLISGDVTPEQFMGDVQDSLDRR